MIWNLSKIISLKLSKEEKSPFTLAVARKKLPKSLGRMPVPLDALT